VAVGDGVGVGGGVVVGVGVGVGVGLGVMLGVGDAVGVTLGVGVTEGVGVGVGVGGGPNSDNGRCQRPPPYVPVKRFVSLITKQRIFVLVSPGLTEFQFEAKSVDR
jgi:hypothetical protein